MNTLLIARRELGAYLRGWTGYLVIAGVLLIDGLLFQVLAMDDSAKYSHDVLEQFFYNTAGTTMIASVLLTMHAVAEESARGTDVLFRAAPISDGSVVMGKYLAAMVIIGAMTLITIYLPALIFVNGKVSLAHIGVGYLGLLGLASASAAVGIFGSTLSRYQLACGFISGVIIVLLLILWLLADRAEPPFAGPLAYGALFQKHFMPFQEGRLLVSGLVYYGTLTFAFLTLATKMLESRRWQ